MKKLLWALSVVLVLVMATGASADIRSDKSNTYSNDLNISSSLDSYSGDTYVWAGSIADDQGAIDYYTNKDSCLLAQFSPQNTKGPVYANKHRNGPVPMKKQAGQCGNK
jgi:hypothetical protein